jgi:lysophospholipase L1-like esterase
VTPHRLATRARSRRAPFVGLALGLAVAVAGSALAAAPASSGPDPVPILAPDLPIPAETLGVSTPISDPSTRALRHFYESLQASARGEHKTNIVVYGASHVAGDMFTRVIRHRLQGLFGDAGIGFVVPSRPWRDYNQRDASLSYSERGWDYSFVSSRYGREDGLYGLAGCSFESGDKRAWCKVGTSRGGTFGTSLDSVEVWYWKQPKGGEFEVVIDGAKAKRVKTRAPDAGPAYATFQLTDGPHEVEIRPRGNGRVLLFGVALDRNRPGVVMDSMGINGARASAQLQWDPRLFAEHLTRRDPDLVVLAYGTNAIGDDDDPIDSYEKRLDLVVNRVRSLLPRTSCLVVGPSDRPIKVDNVGPGGSAFMSFLPRARQEAVITVQKRVAHRYGCGHWDMAAAQGGTLGMVDWVAAEPRLGARDYVHLTRAGYERMADLFWDALMVGYDLDER